LGQAPPISADEAALTNYHSPYDTRPADGALEEDPELSKLRGTAVIVPGIHSLISWTTRKDCPTWIGISLPVKDWVGTDYHETQFWEEPTEPIQFEHTPEGTYDWLTNRMRERSAGNGGRLPIGMPETFEGLSVISYRNGKAGYIVFTLLNSFAHGRERSTGESGSLILAWIHENWDGRQIYIEDPSNGIVGTDTK
jgi:hypothetical protein